jgi:hypothetical protein
MLRLFLVIILYSLFCGDFSSTIASPLSVGSITAFSNELPKVYALYFPQFHEDPLNNKLWGKGYTDWDNVRRSPLFNRFNRTILRPGSSLGYYNLLDVDIRRKHGMLARQYGIDGFIYHHYWFHHKNTTANLAAPLEKMLIDGEPNIPFAFNWAMDSWLGTWHGRGKLGETLYEQVCPFPDDIRIINHYNFLKQFFHHPNYIKINGVPLFFVLRCVPNKCHGVLSKLKELATDDGFPLPGLYIIGGSNPMSDHELYTGKLSRPLDKRYEADYFYPFAAFPNHQAVIPSRCHQLHRKDKQQQLSRLQYLSVMVHFDNTPRRDFFNSTIWDRSFSSQGAAKSFEMDVVTTMMYDKCCQLESLRNKGGKFIVINAWNEWAEGMALEPSESNGTQFLEAVKSAKNIFKTIKCQWPIYNHYINKFKAMEKKVLPPSGYGENYKIDRK